MTYFSSTKWHFVIHRYHVNKLYMIEPAHTKYIHMHYIYFYQPVQISENASSVYECILHAPMLADDNCV